MKALTIVIHLQELNNHGTGMSARVKDMEIDTLDFESAKETFHDGVVVAVGLSAHANGDVVLSQEGLVVMSGILTAAIRMMQQIGLRLALRKCHVQGIVDESSVTAGAHSPTHHTPREEIQYSRQI